MAPSALVTGASGFVGRSLVRRLLGTGWDVSLLVRETSVLDEEVRRRCRVWRLGDDAGALERAIPSAAPDAVFHLAAHVVPVHRSADVRPLIDTNVGLGTWLLDLLSTSETTSFVNVGTIWQHHDSRRYGPTSLYAATKQAFVDVLQYFAECTGVRAATIELPDTYGPEDERGKLLSLLLTAARTGVPLPMTPGDQLVEFVHVEDAVDALLAAAGLTSHDAPSFHVPGEVVPLRRFVEAVGEVLGVDVPVIWGARPYRARETMTTWRFHPPVPGWKPAHALAEELPSVVAQLSRSAGATRTAG